jgi:hypothetical protein
MPLTLDDQFVDRLADSLTITTSYINLALYLLTLPPDTPMDRAALQRALRRAQWATERCAAELRGQPFTTPCPD